jgi:acetyl-CoA acetyltransferase
MTTYTDWRRDKPGLGVWPHRGKVAFAGWGMSPVDRRWDGVSMDRTLGAFSILAAQRALEDAGLKPSDVDGLFQCPNNMAGATGGAAANWGPFRPYFDAPYDSEDGLTIVTNKWMLENFKDLTNVTFAPDGVPDIGEGLGMAAQAVAEGKCKVALFIYTANNLEGRYRRGGEAASNEARGNSQWNHTWGANVIDMQLWTTLPMVEYLNTYGGTWEDVLGPMVVNEHRNGLMNSWGYYTQNGAAGLTQEEYINSRPITWPARIWDYDRPVNAAGAFIITSAERARDCRQKPVYILSHNQGAWIGAARSSHVTMKEYQQTKGMIANMVYEGSGLRPQDVDIFNPYDGFSPFLPFSLEAFQWHGVGEGDTVDFVKGDISIEGKHPLFSSGGNLGSGRTRTAMYIDSILQLRGTAGQAQVNVKAETAICGYSPALTSWYLALSNTLD